MSATLDAAPVAAFLDAPVLASEGRAYPVEIRHAERADDRPLASRVASAAREVLASAHEGHLLVFLPSRREIAAAEERCAALAKEHDLDVLPLHGSLSAAAQDRALAPSRRRKLVLATNVAETSVTIEGVSVVIDSGVALRASLSPWSGLPALDLAKVGKASLAQRAGRAGRTRAGVCVRLFTKADELARPAFDAPEIQRLDLAEPILEMVASGVSDPLGFRWFEAPDPRRAEAALDLLRRLGAVDAGAGGLTLTPIGARMVELPLHPRLARLAIEAEDRGVARDGAMIAGLLGERDARAPDGPYRGPARSSDVVRALDDLDAARELRRDERRARGMDPQRFERVLKVADDLAARARSNADPPGSPEAHERALLACVLAGYPDRVGRLRRPDASTGRNRLEVVFAAGGTAIVAETSAVTTGDLVVAVDAEERAMGGRPRMYASVLSAVELDQVLELLMPSIEDVAELRVHPSTGRVEEVRSLRLGQLVLEETIARPRDAEAARELLAREALRAYGPSGALGALERRVAFVNEHRKDAPLPALDEAAKLAALRDAASADGTLAELTRLDLDELVAARIPREARALLDALAPTHVTLPGGRRVEIVYAEGAPPSISSRLQDFFGMKDGPRVAGGAVPLVLHLLAPNYRDVQVTTDLAGFWAKHYPAIAKELRRRYPRHPFPDDPLTATPPAPRPPRPPR
ncbi:MAG: ATP-dependent helicase C-terminal domain-containing protein [Polyangiaceae bacterium]